MLCILELLKVYVRVLYVDIDVHHGDGVEEAFLTTNRVMTVSFHEYGDHFFPGTGPENSIGIGEGKYYAINVPFGENMDNETYTTLFKDIMSKVLETYRPNVIVLQAGADCLVNDKIGHQNLTIQGHAECVQFLAQQGLPMVLLGGGGYTIQNVAKCWTTEIARLVNQKVPENIPDEDSFIQLY